MTPEEPTPDNFMVQDESNDPMPNLGQKVKEARKAKRKIMQQEEYTLQKDKEMEMW